MTRGRKPTPTVLKVLKGNPGKRPLPVDEPKPTVPRILPAAPATLGPVGAEAWTKTGETLLRSKILTEADLAILEQYAWQYQVWSEAVETLKKTGLVYVPKGSSYPQVNPFKSIADKASKACASLLAELGMTPVSRGRVKTAEARDDGDEFDQLIAARKKA